MSPAWLPTGPTPYGIGAAIVLALLTAALCRPLLAHATGRPAPTDPPQTSGPDRTPDYRAVGTAGFVAAVGASALLAGVAVVGWAPTVAWPAWCGVVSLGVLLGWIDAATTWLPTRLVRPMWLLTALGVVGTAVLGRATEPDGWWVRPMVAVAGAVGYGLVFAVVWRLGRGGLGFGDVRLAVALGAATAACSPTVAVVAAVLGTSMGAVWAIGRLLRGRRGTFPYGPFLLLGALLAPLLVG